MQLPLIDPVLDPCADRRGDSAWIQQQWADPNARVAVFAGERILVDLAQQSRLPAVRWLSPAQLQPADTADTAGTVDTASMPQHWVFLGRDDDQRPYFAASATERWPDEDLIIVRQLGLADPSTPELRIVVTGLALLNWHRRHRFCAQCGAPTVIADAGWVRRCEADGSQHFPRVDPAVIMLVVDDEDRALLGRQSRWPAGWFSTLAGFVEPGETLENAVTREVFEEVAVPVTDVTYRASQPWPFPSSLMLGFHARATTTEVTPDTQEIAEARWFTRSQLRDLCSAGEVRLPPRFSISRYLIELWFGSELPGDWSRE